MKNTQLFDFLGYMGDSLSQNLQINALSGLDYLGGFKFEAQRD
jgi:hypothetical protein